MRLLEEFIYPRLQQFPFGERAEALRKAREHPLDVIELVGIAAALISATALTRYLSTELQFESRVAMLLFTFVVAIPILAILILPFQVRRVRRGLDHHQHRQTEP